MVIQFSNVSELKFRPQSSEVEVAPLEIMCMKDQQWEDWHSYAVFQHEQTGALSFYCEDFEVILVEKEV